MKLNKYVKTPLAAFAAAAYVGSAAAATIAPGDSLIPAGLVAGDTFHLVFVTSPADTIDSSWNISQLNAHVNDIANNNGGYSGSVVASVGATWYGIGSDTSVNANVNALVSAPVYRVDGVRPQRGIVISGTARLRTRLMSPNKIQHILILPW
jgi:hypothetical protein